MKVLIAYASTEGQTQKIAATIAEQIENNGHESVLFDTKNLVGDLEPDAFDKVIVAGSVHEEKHQESVEIFAMTTARKLKDTPTMFVSVSLAAAFDSGRADAERYADMFLKEVGWQPDTIHLAAGAVRHGHYGYYKEQVLEHIVLENRSAIDPEKDHEFTDWGALAQAVEGFVSG